MFYSFLEYERQSKNLGPCVSSPIAMAHGIKMSAETNMAGILMSCLIPWPRFSHIKSVANVRAIKHGMTGPLMRTENPSASQKAQMTVRISGAALHNDSPVEGRDLITAIEAKQTAPRPQSTASVLAM